MRKAFRILFLIAMPLLFILVIAASVSFDGYLALSSSATKGETTLSGKVISNASATLNLNGGLLNIENWVASASKSFKYSLDVTSGYFSLAEDAGGTTISYGGNTKISIQVFLLVGLLFFTVGFFMVEVGYTSKLLTVIGSTLLLIGSVFVFTQTKASEGFHYSFAVVSENGKEEIFSMGLNWLSLDLLVGIALGLSFLNAALVLLKPKKS